MKGGTNGGTRCKQRGNGMTFAEALRKTMAAGHVRVYELADRTGLDRQTIGSLRSGHHNPKPSTASRIAEALNEPELLAIVMRDRVRTCALCGNGFTTIHNVITRRIYCSEKCAQSAGNRRRIVKRHSDFRTERHRLSEYQEAIEDFCHSCEPVDLICRDDTCHLRPVSPLPFIPMHQIRRAA